MLFLEMKIGLAAKYFGAQKKIPGANLSMYSENRHRKEDLLKLMVYGAHHQTYYVDTLSF